MGMYLLLVFKPYETIQRVDGQPNKFHVILTCWISEKLILVLSWKHIGSRKEIVLKINI